jgi:hypothetical protein
MFEQMPINKKELSAEEIVEVAEKEFNALGEAKTSEQMSKELDEAIQNLENPKVEEEDSQEAIN